MIIKIKNLKAETLLGAYAKERIKTRPVIIHLAIDYDHARAVASDALKDAVNYTAIENAITESLPRQKFILLESLADHVARLIMQFPAVREVTVEIEKPGVMHHAETVSVVHIARRA